jgi:hypothetical protein
MMYHGKLEGAPSLTAESLLRAELSNGSRIIALPGGGEGKTVRGFAAVRLAVVDEAARCEAGLFAVVRPMLGTSDGSLIMLSTPFGKRAEFHRAWTEGEGRFAAELGEAHALHEELKDFRRHLTTAGRATYQARTGTSCSRSPSLCGGPSSGASTQCVLVPLLGLC